MFQLFQEIPIAVGTLPGEYPIKVPHYVLLLCRGDVDLDWQWKVAKWIVHSSAMTAAAWGPNTTKWDDAIDWALILEQDEGRLDNARFILTTWHDDEPIEDTMEFLEPLFSDKPPCEGLLVLNAQNTSVPLGKIGSLLCKSN